MRSPTTATVAAVVTLWAATAGAQAPAKSAELDQIKQRQRISLMEGVLERAVANGADNLMRQVKSVMPDVPMLTGAPEVRGFRLDGYGVFFDVEVPALRLPIAWTLRYVDGNRLAVNAALAQLRAMVLEQPAQERERLETLVRQMEQRNVSQVQVPPKVDPEVVRDPNEAYTRAVKEALVDAMIESSGHLNLAPEEWLTVAARDNVPNDPLVPGDASDLRSVIFKIKGSDLSAFRSGQLTLDQARERVKAEEN